MDFTSEYALLVMVILPVAVVCIMNTVLACAEAANDELRTAA